jgi:hypothetical protein
MTTASAARAEAANMNPPKHEPDRPYAPRDPMHRSASERQGKEGAVAV